MGHRLLTGILRRANVSLVGSIALQAFQTKNLILSGNFNFHSVFHQEKEDRDKELVLEEPT